MTGNQALHVLDFATLVDSVVAKYYRENPELQHECPKSAMDMKPAEMIATYMLYAEWEHIEPEK